MSRLRGAQRGPRRPWRVGDTRRIDGASHVAGRQGITAVASAARGDRTEGSLKVLIAYASRHGATEGIAQRVAGRLERRGLEVVLVRADQAADLDRYDAFVIGSAAYISHWLKEATQLVRRHRSLLASRPVWLFSSGPIGTDLVDAKGRDVFEASLPAEFAEFAGAIHPRDERVFFGAYDPDAEPIGLMERVGARFTRMSAVREAIPSGDFRDWPAIETWADGIARELRPAVSAAGATA